ncbi:hypothetical protein [Legionella quinlivanii]|uniref:hypothetical protein n=1 Tax=Legionella quinlivanii TaxID=45073 RepID=UPI002244E106|nr:hypothetical protein [Legionella quinlivanii]MCW8449900.1 hypothetical protein [Legionella quinlivanii]
MGLLDNQYESINDSTQRAKFRSELLKLNNTWEKENVLRKQSQESLTRLQASIGGVLAQAIPPKLRSGLDNLLRITTDILSGKQEDVPIDYNLITQGGSRLFQVSKGEGEPYFSLYYPKVLNSVMRKVLDSHEYERIGHTTWGVEDRINVTKKSIHGHEAKLATAIQQEIVVQKSQIIEYMKGKILQQQQRCQSDATRQENPRLQSLAKQAQEQLNELDAILQDEKATASKILDVIDSFSQFNLVVDQSISQHRQGITPRQRHDAFRTQLKDIAQQSPAITQESSHDWSNNRMKLNQLKQSLEKLSEKRLGQDSDNQLKNDMKIAVAIDLVNNLHQLKENLDNNAVDASMFDEIRGTIEQEQEMAAEKILKDCENSFPQESRLEAKKYLDEIRVLHKQVVSELMQSLNRSPAPGM